MTREEANKNLNNKVMAIQTLCKQMQVTISAEQAITKDGLIKQIIFYTDNENYNIEEPKQNEESNKKTSDLREEDTEAGVRVRPDTIRDIKKDEKRTDRRNSK